MILRVRIAEYMGQTGTDAGTLLSHAAQIEKSASVCLKESQSDTENMRQPRQSDDFSWLLVSWQTTISILAIITVIKKEVVTFTITFSKAWIQVDSRKGILG